MLVVQYLSATFVKTSKTNVHKNCEISIWSQIVNINQFCHFLTNFSLVYILGNGFDSSWRVSKSHGDIVIFGGELCEKIWKNYKN